MESIDKVEFLRQVARHYASEAPDNLGALCFVLPSRRALVSFRYYLAEELKGKLSRPLVAPQLYTVNDFFYKASGRKVTDKVTLLLELYDCYKTLNPRAESLDEFICWGDVIISDFNEVDKYLVNPKDLFTNISELKNMSDDWSDLTENQERAIKEFISHLRDGGKGEIKEKFLRTWDILYDLYKLFNEKLSEKGLSYEGMVYRELSERALGGESVADMVSGSFDGVDKFVFAGLNALNKCEKTLLRRLEKAGLADFCWDYCSDWIKDPRNCSSHFLKDNILEFPQAFTISAPKIKPEINVLSVPSSVGQAKQLPGILSTVTDGFSYVPGIETAVVLPDENLLSPVLNSIPECVDKLNVTMGYPIGGSAFHTLVRDICSLQKNIRIKEGEEFFYHKPVWAILSSGIMRKLLPEETLRKFDSVKAEGRYYVSKKALETGGITDLIFRKVVPDATVASEENTLLAGGYLKEVVSALAIAMKTAEEEDFSLELEFARSYWKALTQLCDHRLPLLPSSFFRLLERTVSLDSVHFHGEPMKGLQVMGPLETRALDFRNLVILSCNEGVFPRHPVSSSFIPHELRKAFELPTYEYQDAIWAYYFYRLLERSEKVWLVFDSRFEGVRSGEESRYIKQLELHFGAPVHRYVASTPLCLGKELEPIGKTDELDKALKERPLSASALKSYLDCPAKFYYGFVLGLKDADEVSESLDAGMFGDVYHKTMEHFYTRPDGFVPAPYLRKILSDVEGIRAEVDSQICEALHCFEVSGRNLVFEDIAVRYLKRTIERDLELLDSSGAGGFEVLGLEKKFHINVGNYRFKGYIDRLDSLSPDSVRVVDYKTGKVEDKDVNITDENAASVVESLFGEENSKRPKIALQLYIYDRFARENYGKRRIFNSIYAPSDFFTGGVKNVPLSGEFTRLMDERVPKLLDEIADRSKPFTHTCDVATCKNCDFKTICGR